MGVVVSCNYLLDTWLRSISAKDSHSGQKNILYYLYKGGVLQGRNFFDSLPGPCVPAVRSHAPGSLPAALYPPGTGTSAFIPQFLPPAR